MAQTTVWAVTQASETDAQWGTRNSPSGAVEGKPAERQWSRRSKSPEEQRSEWVREGLKRSETTTEGLSAMPTEGESVAND